MEHCCGQAIMVHADHVNLWWGVELLIPLLKQTNEFYFCVKIPCAIDANTWEVFAQQAINVITTHELDTANTTFTPRALVPFANTKRATCFKHYASPMVHPITDETISSYKKLMNNPATTEVWQTAFGKDFDGMAQGCNKTGQKGTCDVCDDKSGNCKRIDSRQKVHLRISGRRSPPTKGRLRQN